MLYYVFIGQMKRHIFTEIFECITDTRLENQLSAVSEPSIEIKHGIKSDRTEVLASIRTFRSRIIEEATEIINTRRSKRWLIPES
jgi:hypothetical protein